MKGSVTGTKDWSANGNTGKLVFIRGDDDKSYSVCVVKSFGNAQRWWNLRKGHQLDGLLILGKNKINGDSPIIVKGFSDEPL
jgi:hypothetical protein